MNVLIVSDDGEWAHTVSALLRTAVNRILIAPSYREAKVTMDKPNGFDVVLLSTDLPDISSETAFENIRVINDSHRKVVLVSGSKVSQPMMDYALLKGAVDCVFWGDVNAARLKAACA